MTLLGSDVVNFCLRSARVDSLPTLALFVFECPQLRVKSTWSLSL